MGWHTRFNAKLKYFNTHLNVKRLYRSKDNRRISGVFGGLGNYLRVDATLLRIIAVFLAFFIGVIPAILGYILAAIIIPEEGDPDAR